MQTIDFLAMAWILILLILHSTFVNTTGHLPSDFDTQYPAPWHLQFISNRDPGHYTFPFRFDESAGEGIYVYVLDDGFDPYHPEFGPGQVEFGKTFAPKRCLPGVNHHGTAVASMVIDQYVGVVKKATVVDVQVGTEVEGCKRPWAFESALLWTLLHIIEHDRLNRSVVNLSWNSDKTCKAIDFMLSRLYNHGIPVVASAGNNAHFASNYCPGNSSWVTTVGSMDPFWSRSPFSNIGGAVEIFAPRGHASVADSMRVNHDALREAHGTSFAAPMVGGVIAYHFAMDGYLDPESMRQLLKDSEPRTCSTIRRVLRSWCCITT